MSDRFSALINLNYDTLDVYKYPAVIRDVEDLATSMDSVLVDSSSKLDKITSDFFVQIENVKFKNAKQQELKLTSLCLTHPEFDSLNQVVSDLTYKKRKLKSLADMLRRQLRLLEVEHQISGARTYKEVKND